MILKQNELLVVDNIEYGYNIYMATVWQQTFSRSTTISLPAASKGG